MATRKFPSRRLDRLQPISLTSPLGKYQLFDFSPIREPGTYAIRAETT
jgi:hypothetical protein